MKKLFRKHRRKIGLILLGLLGWWIIKKKAAAAAEQPPAPEPYNLYTDPNFYGGPGAEVGGTRQGATKVGNGRPGAG